MNRLYINRDWSTLKKLLALKAAGGGSAPQTGTATGSLVTFSTTKALPLIECVVGIDPVQDLHGQESPYPAGGGKNQAYTSLEGGSVGVTGGIGINQSYDMAIAKVESGVTYTVTTDDSQLVCAFYETEPYIGITTSYDSTRTVQASKTFTAPITGWIAFRVQSGFATYQCEKGTTATTYAPYSNICPISGWTGANVVVSPTTDAQDGTTYPISWQSEAGTVYGGTLDVTTGVLTVTHGNIASYNGESLPGKWISSMDVYSVGGTPTTGAQVVYELATPQTIRLSPSEIKTLVGENNIWTDTGNITVKYYK